MNKLEHLKRIRRLQNILKWSDTNLLSVILDKLEIDNLEEIVEILEKNYKEIQE